jgi:hypothetical protein
MVKRRKWSGKPPSDGAEVAAEHQVMLLCKEDLRLWQEVFNQRAAGRSWCEVLKIVSRENTGYLR